MQCYAEKRVYSHSGRQKHHLTMLVFLLYEQQNNISFLRVRMNQSTKIGTFCRKRGVYKLIGLVDDSTCMYYKCTFSVDVGMTLRLDSRTPCELECIVATCANKTMAASFPGSQVWGAYNIINSTFPLATLYPIASVVMLYS